MLFLTSHLEHVTLRRVELGGKQAEGAHELGACALCHMREGRAVAALRRMNRFLQALQVSGHQPRKLCHGRCRRWLVRAEASQLTDSEADLRDCGVVLGEVRRIAGQQEASLIGLGVGERTIEVVQRLKYVVGALHARARIS